MELIRNRSTALLAAATVAMAFSACGDDDGNGVAEGIEREGKKAGKAAERKGRKDADDIKRKADDTGKKAKRAAGETADDAKREGKKAGGVAEREGAEAKDDADREIGEDDVSTKKDSDAR